VATAALIHITVASCFVVATTVAFADGPAPQVTSIEVAWLRDVASFFSSAGPYGVLAGLMWVIRFLWQENKAKDAVIEAQRAQIDAVAAALRAQVDAVQEKRIAESVANAERTTKVATEATTTISEAIKTSAENTSILRALVEKTGGIVPLLQEVSGKIDRNLTEYRGLHQRDAG
jgi:RNase P/RNase MRP subunit POP5